MRYIGSKTALRSDIRAIVESIAPRSNVFCDLFAGTGAVGREFKSSHRLICNDIMFFSYVLNRAHNGLKHSPEFRKLSKNLNTDPINHLNSIRADPNEVTEDDFMTISFSPAGDARRQYLSVENALRIDKIRKLIGAWRAEELIDDNGFHYLLAALIEAVPSVSNTTGTYGAYLKHWDQRALKPLLVEPLEIEETTFDNEVFNADANTLIRSLRGDVLYLDTPYNGRQYSSNYHLLETLARYDEPVLKGITGTRTDRAGASVYCRKNLVYEAFEDLLSRANFGALVISYSSDGLLTRDQVSDLLLKQGKKESLKIREIHHRRYKRVANDQRHVTEYLMGINR